MEDVIAGTVAPRRTQTAVMWLFAGMSLLLGGIGPPTYGVATALTGVMVLSGTVARALGALRVDPARALRAE